MTAALGRCSWTAHRKECFKPGARSRVQFFVCLAVCLGASPCPSQGLVSPSQVHVSSSLMVLAWQGFDLMRGLAGERGKACPASCLQPESQSKSGTSKWLRGQSPVRGSWEGRRQSPRVSVGGQPRRLADIRAGECGGSSSGSSALTSLPAWYQAGAEREEERGE